MDEDKSLRESHYEVKLASNQIENSYNQKKTQLDRVIDHMFQNESDRIINDEEIDNGGYSQVIITIIAIMMSVVILLSFLYRFL